MLDRSTCAATCIHNLLVWAESTMRRNKSCAVPATAHQPLQEVVKSRQPQRGIDRIARESRHFVRTVSNFWMAKWANWNAGPLLPNAMFEAISAGANPAVAFKRPSCHRVGK